MEFDATTVIGWCVAVATGGFAAGFKACHYLKDDKEEVLCSCSRKEDEDEKHIATLLRSNILPEPITQVKVLFRKKKPYHCDCNYFDMPTHSCRLSSSEEVCLLLKTPRKNP